MHWPSVLSEEQQVQQNVCIVQYMYWDAASTCTTDSDVEIFTLEFHNNATTELQQNWVHALAQERLEVSNCNPPDTSTCLDTVRYTQACIGMHAISHWQACKA